MEIIKTYQQEGAVISNQVLSAVATSGCNLAVFSSVPNYSQQKKHRLDRGNLVSNYLTAGTYRDKKDYSIFMDDDVIITRDAINLMLKYIEDYEIVTVPVSTTYRSQHQCLIVKNYIVDQYPIKLWNENYCNGCVWVAHLTEKKKYKIKVLDSPILKEAPRKILKKVGI